MNEAIQNKRKFWSSIALMSFITFVSRILGLAREMVKAYFLGTGAIADAFNLAFALPNLFRRLTAEGAMLNAFVPVLTEIKNKEGHQSASYFCARFFWLLLLGLTLLSSLFIFFASWLLANIFAPGFDEDTMLISVFLTRFIFVYVVFISLSAILQGILNSHRVFWVSAATPILLNLSIIGLSSIWVFGLGQEASYGLALGVLLGGILQLLVQFPKAHALGYRLKIGRDPIIGGYVKKIFIYLIPSIFGAGIYQINIVISNSIASGLAVGSITALNFSNRLLELSLGIFAISITTAILPALSQMIQQQEYKQAADQISESISVISFIAFPIIAGMLVTAEDLVTVLFRYGSFDQNSVRMTVLALLFHIPGLIFIAWNRILASAFHAGKYFRLTVKISFFTMIINIIGAYFFSLSWQHQGIALASTLSQGVQTIIMIWLGNRYFPNSFRSDNFISALKHILASGVMGFVVFLTQKYLTDFSFPLFLKYFAYIFIGLLAYLSASAVFKSREYVIILGVLSKKKKKYI